MGRQLVTLHALDAAGRTDERRAELARALDGTVGAPDEGGMLEVEVEADSHEQALRRVGDAIASAGADDHFTFPAQTGTGYHPPGERAPDPDEQPDAEPPHLERGSPRTDEPGPDQY